MAEFYTLVQTFGFPAGSLITLSVFLWRVLIWLKPYVEKIIDAHVNMISTTTVTIKQLGEAQEKQADTLVSLAATHEQQSKVLQQQTVRLDQIQQTLDQARQGKSTWGK